MDPVPLVAFTRGSVLESIHYGSLAVVDADGKLVASAGDPERLTTLRSTAKPFQAMAVLELGAFDRFNGTPSELAVAAGSHSGEPRHTTAVAAMLERAGFSVESLQTGVHPPYHEPTRDALTRAGTPPSALHHNCSGNHCGMLWACAHRDWDERTYVRPDHPLQRRIRSIIGIFAGWPEAEIPISIDGCSAPTFALPLMALARSFGRLASERGISETHAQAARRVRTAMVSHPEMVGGEGRFDTDLMQSAGGRILSKAGAEGCQAVALLDNGWGVGIKIEDGSARAAPVAVIETLRQLGAIGDEAIDVLSGHARPPVFNLRNEVVGEGHPLFTLSTA
ncbi:MAG: asparaginase [Chloroflexi bacterium]|nr:asparaginase [Chloroflexota bacterium]